MEYQIQEDTEYQHAGRVTKRVSHNLFAALKHCGPHPDNIRESAHPARLSDQQRVLSGLTADRLEIKATRVTLKVPANICPWVKTSPLGSVWLYTAARCS